MLVLRDPIHLPDHPIITCLSALLEQRFRDLSGDEIYDPDCHGYIVIAEPGDEVKALEEETGIPIFSDSQYPTTSFEYLDDTPLCYEMVFIINDGGFAVLLFVPKMTGVNADLLKMCLGEKS
jgi:hypothetical protein